MPDKLNVKLVPGLVEGRMHVDEHDVDPPPLEPTPAKQRAHTWYELRHTVNPETKHHSMIVGRSYGKREDFYEIGMDQHGGMWFHRLEDMYGKLKDVPIPERTLGYIYSDMMVMIAEGINKLQQIHRQEVLDRKAEYDRRVAERIPVIANADAPLPPLSEQLPAAIAEGKALQGYWLSRFRTAVIAAQELGVECDVWCIIRQDDPIVMWVPVGTPEDKLPLTAMEYMVTKWRRVTLDQADPYE